MNSKFYKRQANNYMTYDINLLMIILGIVMLVLSLKSLLHGYSMDFGSFNSVLKTLSPVGFILSFVCIGIGVRRTRIFPNEYKMVKEYMFGIYRKPYQVNKPINVKVLTTYKQERRIESYVNIDTATGSTTIRRFPKSKEIEDFVNETYEIFK